MSLADDERISGLRAHADQAREGLKEVAALVAGFYAALIGAGAPPSLALVITRDWHRSTFLLPSTAEEADDA